MTYEEALKVFEKELGYISCVDTEHGFGDYVTYGGITAPAKIVLCPVIQFYPKPSYLFHNKADVINAALGLKKEHLT